MPPACRPSLRMLHQPHFHCYFWCWNYFVTFQSHTPPPQPPPPTPLSSYQPVSLQCARMWVSVFEDPMTQNVKSEHQSVAKCQLDSRQGCLCWRSLGTSWFSAASQPNADVGWPHIHPLSPFPPPSSSMNLIYTLSWSWNSHSQSVFVKQQIR